MKFLRILITPLLAAGLLLVAGNVYSPTVLAKQNDRSAQSKKPTQFHYVCPMHDNVTSKTPGTCRKCKMKLVRKPIVKEPTTDSN
jgi:Heavy metal binding domain